jgi:hypothetical protein
VKFPEPQLIVDHLDEPALEFGHGQKTAHPKDGLFLYGPHGRTNKAHDIRLGLIGTSAGIAHFKNWAKRLHGRIDVPPPKKGEKANRLHLANFPGLVELFGISFDSDACAAYPLNERDIDAATRILNLHEAVAKVVKLYVERALKHMRNDERAIDVWVLVVPEIISERCRPQAKRSGLSMELGDFAKKQKARSELPLLADVIDQEAEDIFEDVPDFHRQVKAAFLTIGPSQILRETTLAPEAFLNKAGYPQRKMQDPATIAWNFATGLYYKTEPRPPWKLATVRPRVCYVGLVYKNLPNDPNGHVCCAAQMFLNEGDGVVFRGANGPWKTGDDEYHLDGAAAKTLLATVLETYSESHGGPPQELFIHGQASFNNEEWRAFEEAAPKDTNVVGVRIRTTGGETKLFRDGDYPVLRGTAMQLDLRNAYLWTTGYLPQLDTYIGPETPNPLFITVLRAKNAMPKLDTVLVDIMGLTKINYNSCNFNDGLPVTVRFAKMVGEVLVMGSAKGAQRQPFKYYV